MARPQVGPAVSRVVEEERPVLEPGRVELRIARDDATGVNCLPSITVTRTSYPICWIIKNRFSMMSRLACVPAGPLSVSATRMASMPAVRGGSARPVSARGSPGIGVRRSGTIAQTNRLSKLTTTVVSCGVVAADGNRCVTVCPW